jgi:hypothetical protein
MGLERSGLSIHWNANGRPVLSSERALHIIIKKYSDQEKERKNLLMGPKAEPKSKIDWPTER